MPRVSRQQPEHVRDQINHGFKGLDRTGRLARKVQNHRLPTHPTHRPAQGRKLGGLRSL